MSTGESAALIIGVCEVALGITLILSRKFLGAKFSKIAATFGGGNREPLPGSAFMVLFGSVLTFIRTGMIGIGSGLLE